MTAPGSHTSHAWKDLKEMKLIIFFPNQVLKEKLDGKLHQCALRIDHIVFRRIFHSKRDQVKKKYKLYFLSFNNIIFI
jgi:hypothetical protein